MNDEKQDDTRPPDATSWTCVSCGEIHDMSFTACWQCGQTQGGPPGQAATDPDAAEPRYCLGCDYRLRGLSEPRCPECGRAFDPADPATFRALPGERPVKTFEVHEHPRAGIQVVKRGFSWPGFFFGYIWAFTKELWVAGFLLFFGLSIVNEVVTRVEMVGPMTFGVMIAVSILIGFKGNDWRRAALGRCGYELRRVVKAQTPAGAVAIARAEERGWRQPHASRRVLVSLLLVLALSFGWAYAVTEQLGPTPAERRFRARVDRRQQTPLVRPPVTPRATTAAPGSPSSSSPQSRHDRTVASLTRRIAQNPDAPAAYHQRGHAYERTKEWAKAAADFAAAVERDPANGHYRAVLVNAWLSAERPDEALRAVHGHADHLLGQGDDGWALNNLAWRLVAGERELRDATRALALIERAVQIDPDNPSWINTLGAVYYRLDRVEEAITALHRSDRLDGSVEDVVFLALSHLASGDPESARTYADRLPPLMRLRHTDEQGRLATELAAALRSAVTSEQTDARPAAALASVLFALDDRAMAMAAVTTALEREPRDAQAHLVRGELHAAERRWPEAERDASEAIRLDASIGRAWLLRGRARSASGHPGVADDYRHVLTHAESDRVALLFDGRDDRGTVPFIPLDRFDALTIEAWVLGWTGPIASQGRSGDPENSIWISVGRRVADTAEVCGWESGAGRNHQGPVGELLDAAWTHLALVFDGERQRVFVNGVLVRQARAPQPGPLVPERDFEIGAFDGSQRQFGHGLLGALMISAEARYENAFVPDATMQTGESTVLLLDAADAKESLWPDRSDGGRHATITGALQIRPESGG